MGIGKVEILNVDENKFAFRTECEHCDAEPIIQGNLKTEITRNRKRSSFVTPAKIQGIRNALSNFKGKSVKDLF